VKKEMKKDEQRRLANHVSEDDKVYVKQGKRTTGFILYLNVEPTFCSAHDKTRSERSFNSIRSHKH
jgi:hypothetical protein